MSVSPAQTAPAARRKVRPPPQRAKFRRGTLGERIALILGPAGISLAFHVGLITMLTFVTWAVGAAGQAIRTEFSASIVADADSGERVGGFRFPGAANSDAPDSREAGAAEDLASLLARDKSLQVTPVDVGDSGLEDIAFSELSRADVTGTAVIGDSGSGEGSLGLGDRDLAGGGPVGALWGVGRGQQARSVVYVMDNSGSMYDTFVMLQRELKKAIGSLNADQRFNLVWLNPPIRGVKSQTWMDKMVSADIEHKRAAFRSIMDIVPSGDTRPVPAVKEALRFQPDVLFILSDGGFGEDNEKIMRDINQLNRFKRTTINTILFMYDASGDPEPERVLREIAESNNGTFKHVTEEDVRLN